jgi:hypothetical protein
MKTLTNVAFGAVIASTSLMIAHAPAQAALLGDEVRAELIAVGIGTLLDETDTVIDPGIEFTVLGNFNSSFSLDVKSDSFDIIYDNGTAATVGADTTWILSDLDWVDTPGIVTGVTLTGGNGNASLITGTSFTDDSITIDIANFFTPPEPTISTWTFDIQTQKQTTPEPGTILGLLTFAGLGLGSRFKKCK